MTIPLPPRTDTSPIAMRPPAPAPSSGSVPDALPRQLGFWAATAIVVGTIIGSGIFRVAGSVATQAGSSGTLAAIWIGGGIITLCGALTLAELGAAFPQSGGVFVYLREAYGSAIAFLFGWTLLILVPAATGGVALVFAEYLGRLIPLGPTGTRAAATAAVILVTVSGYRSVRGASAILGVATWGKVAAIAGLVAVSFLLGDGHAGSFGSGAPAMRGMHWSGLALGLVSALWAYNGFQEMVSVAGEVRDPHRIVPLALLAGTITVVIVYLAANAAYLYVLPFAVLQTSPLVASDTAVRVLGAAGERAVAAMVMVSTFGTVTGLTLSNPRVFYAMARERLLFEPLGRVHPRFATPHVAIATFGALTCLFVWTGTFEQLASAYILGVWPFLSLAAAGVLVLRRTRPDLPRPYRTPGYPIVPLVFILGTVWVVGSALVADPWKVLQGLGLTALGVPVYLFWRRR